ncbi:hypothetical protein HDA31_004974 [Micromonospora carbonacea subsp. aurantiaca]|nr:hypothetical protein [Micromonospora carbonacea]
MGIYSGVGNGDNDSRSLSDFMGFGGFQEAQVPLITPDPIYSIRDGVCLCLVSEGWCCATNHCQCQC